MQSTERAPGSSTLVIVSISDAGSTVIGVSVRTPSVWIAILQRAEAETRGVEQEAKPVGYLDALRSER
jgi:hypothetical protein